MKKYIKLVHTNGIQKRRLFFQLVIVNEDGKISRLFEKNKLLLGISQSNTAN